MNKKTMLLALGLAASSFSISVQAADTKAGKDAFEACRGCHTSPGASNVYPSYYVPKIGGQGALYTASALTAYKNSDRPHRTMMANSYDLSEQKIENIAAYLATATNGSAKAIANGGDAKNGKKLAATCISCHTEKASTDNGNPSLSGQHANYLEHAIMEYQTGKRKNAVMQSMVQGLSEDEVKDISAYYNSLKGLTAID